MNICVLKSLFGVGTFSFVANVEKNNILKKKLSGELYVFLLGWYVYLFLRNVVGWMTNLYKKLTLSVVNVL